jgi:hypothetical protein
LVLLFRNEYLENADQAHGLGDDAPEVAPSKRHSGPVGGTICSAKFPPPTDANVRSGRQHVADAAGVVRLHRRSEMPVRGQLCGDCSQATAQACLG